MSLIKDTHENVKQDEVYNAPAETEQPQRRGRMKTKTRKMNFVASDEEYDMISQKADELGMSMTKLIIRAVQQYSR